MINRIFGIGLSRTGTTSLTHALQHVGINTIHYPTKLELFDPSVQAVTDLPVARYFKELDKRFPNSRFIYTTRDKESWLLSAKNHFSKHKISNKRPWFQENRLKIYGSLTFDYNLFSRAFDSHNQLVHEYFRNRDDFIALDITKGDGWDQLLPFIEVKTAVTIDFPHKRKTSK